MTLDDFLTKSFAYISTIINDTVVEASQLQQKVDDAKGKLTPNNKGITKSVNAIFDAIEQINLEKIYTDKLADTSWLTHIDNAGVDINAFLSLPENMVLYSPASVKSLLIDKLAMIKKFVSQESINTLTKGKLNKDEFFNAVENIINTLLNLPEDIIDYPQQAKTSAITKQVNEAKTAAINLVSSVLGIDIDQEKIAKRREQFNSVINTLTDQTISSETGRDETQALALVSTEKSAVTPVANTKAENTKTENIEKLVTPTSNQASDAIIDDVFALFEDKYPAIKTELADIDWDKLDVKIVAAKIKTIFAIFTDKATDNNLQKLIDKLANKVINAEIDTEQLIEKINTIFNISEKELTSLTSLKAIRYFIAAKINALFELLNEIKIEGFSPQQWQASLQPIIKAIEDFDQEDLITDIYRFCQDKYPAISAELEGLDPQKFDVRVLVTKIKNIFAIIKNTQDHPNMEKFICKLDKLITTGDIDIDEFTSKLVNIFTLSEHQEQQLTTLTALDHFINEKFDDFIALLKLINIKGVDDINSKKWQTSISKFINTVEDIRTSIDFTSTAHTINSFLVSLDKYLPPSYQQSAFGTVLKKAENISGFFREYGLRITLEDIPDMVLSDEQDVLTTITEDTGTKQYLPETMDTVTSPSEPSASLETSTLRKPALPVKSATTQTAQLKNTDETTDILANDTDAGKENQHSEYQQVDEFNNLVKLFPRLKTIKLSVLTKIQLKWLIHKLKKAANFDDVLRQINTLWQDFSNFIHNNHSIKAILKKLFNTIESIKTLIITLIKNVLLNIIKIINLLKDDLFAVLELGKLPKDFELLTPIHEWFNPNQCNNMIYFGLALPVTIIQQLKLLLKSNQQPTANA